jgi:hypothetical protein
VLQTLVLVFYCLQIHTCKYIQNSQSFPCGHLHLAVTCIKRSPFSCPVGVNFICIKRSPVLTDNFFFIPKVTPLYRFDYKLISKGDLLLQVWLYQFITISFIVFFLSYLIYHLSKFNIRLTCFKTNNCLWFLHDSITYSYVNKSSISFIHPFPHFYIICIYHWTCSCLEYSWNTARWTLSNNQSINPETNKQGYGRQWLRLYNSDHKFNDTYLESCPRHPSEV